MSCWSAHSGTLQTVTCVGLQVSVFDSINSQGGYSRRVRRLGEFHPVMSAATATDAQDLDDPLYGNARDVAEKVLDPLLCGGTCLGLAGRSFRVRYGQHGYPGMSRSI